MLEFGSCQTYLISKNPESGADFCTLHFKIESPRDWFKKMLVITSSCPSVSAILGGLSNTNASLIHSTRADSFLPPGTRETLRVIGESDGSSWSSSSWSPAVEPWVQNRFDIRGQIGLRPDKCVVYFRPQLTGRYSVRWPCLCSGKPLDYRVSTAVL